MLDLFNLYKDLNKQLKKINNDKPIFGKDDDLELKEKLIKLKLKELKKVMLKYK